MNRNILLICLTVLVFILFKSADIWQGAQNKQVKVMALEKEVARLKDQGQSLQRMDDMPLLSVTDNYTAVHESLRVLTVFSDLKGAIEIIDAPDNLDINQTSKPSPWPGIDRIAMRVGFSNVVGEDQYVRIFKGLNELQEKHPLSITAIHQAGKELDVHIDIFGAS